MSTDWRQLNKGFKMVGIKLGRWKAVKLVTEGDYFLGEDKKVFWFECEDCGYKKRFRFMRLKAAGDCRCRNCEYNIRMER